MALEDKKISYLEWGDYVLGADNSYGIDNCRKGYYFVSKMLDKIDLTENYSSDDVIKLIESQRDELYKERVKLQDQRREYNKNLREEARWENLKETFLDLIMSKPQIEFKKDLITDFNNEGVLLCSDWHIGLKIENTKNYFDLEVATERVEQLTNKTINYCKLNKVKKLNVLLLGYFIS